MGSGASCTVLIVEDNGPFRQALRDALRVRFPGITVLEAEDMTDGARQVRAKEPHVVFVDISLPDGNGLDLVGVVRRERPTATVVVCTSYDLPEYREVARLHGAAHFLAKQELDWDEVGDVVAQASCREEERRASVA